MRHARLPRLTLLTILPTWSQGVCASGKAVDVFGLPANGCSERETGAFGAVPRPLDRNGFPHSVSSESSICMERCETAGKGGSPARWVRTSLLLCPGKERGSDDRVGGYGGKAGARTESSMTTTCGSAVFPAGSRASRRGCCHFWDSPPGSGGLGRPGGRPGGSESTCSDRFEPKKETDKRVVLGCEQRYVWD